MTLEGEVVRELDEGNLGDPTVTPDGKSVIYWRNDEGSSDGGALYRVAVNGGGSPDQLTEGGDGEDVDPAVSANGRLLAFSRSTRNGRVIMTAPFDGKELTAEPRARTDGKNDRNASWSPDGLQIAYKSGPDSNGDLYVLDLESGDSERVVDNPEHDTQPAWTPR
jgi:Tol biopolymer transport system component